MQVRGPVTPELRAEILRLLRETDLSVAVIAAQTDLVRVEAHLRQLICVKG